MQKVRIKMSCNECVYAPKTYEEFCIAQRSPSLYCPDANTEKSYLCGNYEKEDTSQERGKEE